VEVLVVAACELILVGRQFFFLFFACFPSFALFFFCFVFLAMAVLLVAHGTSGVSSDREKETREILQCLSSSPPCLVSPLLLFSYFLPLVRFLL
jgi:hypothetical protein